MLYKNILRISISILFFLITISLSTYAYAQVKFPVKISSDKRYLTDANNKPFPILGRTAWFILSQSDSGFKLFIDNTIAHGYNAIELSVITHWPTGNHAPYNVYGAAPFLKQLDGQDWDGHLEYKDKQKESPDLLTPNESYWSRVDSMLAYCEAKGILVFMFPAYVGYPSEKEEQGWMKELVANGTINTEAYGAWIANRYRTRKNITWMLLGDKGTYTKEQEQAEAALIKGLKSVKEQQSVEYSAESNSGENAADNEQFGKEMTLNGCYTWELKVPVPYLARKAYAHEPVMPAFLLEEPYDEEGPDGNNYNPNATQPVRRFQWWGWLSTIAGYISGNGYVWQFTDPVWQQHLNTQGAKDMMRLNSFITSIKWWQLVPSGLNDMPQLVNNTNIDKLENYIAAAATKDGSLLIAYIPPAFEGSVTINLKPLQNNMYAYWFDPTSGKYISISSIPFTNTIAQTFKPVGKNSRGENDWVLILSKEKLE